MIYIILILINPFSEPSCPVDVDRAILEKTQIMALFSSFKLTLILWKAVNTCVMRYIILMVHQVVRCRANKWVYVERYPTHLKNSEFPRSNKWDDKESNDLKSSYTSVNTCVPNKNYLWMIEESLYIWYHIQRLLLLIGLKAFSGLWLYATSSPMTWYLWRNLSLMKEQHRVQCAVEGCCYVRRRSCNGDQSYRSHWHFCTGGTMETCSLGAKINYRQLPSVWSWCLPDEEPTNRDI